MENGKIKVWLPTIRTGSGADIFTLRLAKALKSQGLAAEITWFPLRYELLPFLLRYVKPPQDTDIVFANSWSGFAFKRQDLPLVVTVHHSAFDPSCRQYYSRAQNLYHDLLIRPFEKKSFHNADAITSVSQFSADSATRHFGVSTNINVIYNWIDTNFFRPLTQLNRPSNQVFRLLFVGKPSKLKGTDLLATILRQLGPDFELSIAGKINSKEDYNFPSNVHLLGLLNEQEIVNAYQQCDALLFPSRSEGFSYVTLEAMACGKPVIASNITALPEIIVDGITGILCPINDIDAFVNACRRLANNPVDCKQMGEMARKRAVENYSESAIINQYVDLIKRLINQSSSASFAS